MLNKIKEFWNKTLDKVQTKGFWTSSYYSGFEHYQDVESLATYKKSLYLYIGVTMIAKRAAGIDWLLYKVINAAGDTEELLDHDVLDVFNKPNPHSTEKEFKEVSAMFYLLAGECIWWLPDYAQSGRITEIYNLLPDKVEVKLSQDKKEIVAYVYNPGGEEMVLNPQEIIHVKNPDLENPLRGVSIIRPARERIISEREAVKYEGSFFKSQGVPHVAVMVDKETISPEEAAANRSSWSNAYSGKHVSAGFFPNTVKDIKVLSINPKDSLLGESILRLRDDILAALHIPKAMIQPNEMTYASVRVAKQMYLEEAVIPVVQAFIDQVNNKLLPNIDDTIYFDYDNPVEENRDLLIKELQALTGKVYTQNEARERVGLAPMEGADQLQSVDPFSFSLTPATDQRANAKRIIKSRPLLRKRFKAIGAVAEMLVAEHNSKEPERKSLFETEDQKTAYWKSYDVNRQKEEDQATFKIKKHFAEQKKRVIERFKDYGTTTGFWDSQEEYNKTKELLRPFFIKMYQDYGAEISTSITPEKDTNHYFHVTDEMMALIQERLDFFINSMNQTSFRELERIVAQGLSEGKGIDQIARDISETFEGFSRSRSQTIARTESAFIVSKATLDAYQQNPFVSGVEWVTTRDDNVRPLRDGKINQANVGTVNDHVQNDGVIVPKGGTFPNGERFPGELTINCRCAIAPTL